jgi:single-strand DNA-binding protein
MSSLNQVSIIGNVGKDPEVRRFQNGNEVASFSVACSEKWKDKETGEVKERTDWIPVAVFAPGLVKVVRDYVSKGSKVFIQGRFQTRKWQDKEGQDRYTTEVVLNFDGKIVLLGGRGGAGERDEGRGYDDSPRRQNRASEAPRGSGGMPAVADDLDDEVPF